MDNWVLITGSARGIGLGIAQEFKRRDWKCIGVDNRPSDNDVSNLFFAASAANSKDMFDVASALKNKGIQINCIVNNAAVQCAFSLLETSEEQWNHVISINLTSIFHTTKAFQPLMQNPASIINISSVHARATSAGMAAYVASKGGVSALTRAMALELCSLGIRVNAILPGAIDTDMLKLGIARDPDPKAAKQTLITRTPLGRVGQPREIAELAFFLAASGFITGQEFICDGGALARLGSE